MHLVKFASFNSGLGPAAILCALVLGLTPCPGWAADEKPPEALPKSDPWRSDTEVAPYWKSERIMPDLQSRAERHREFMQAGIPLDYRSRKSPYAAATKVIQDGGRLYRSHCAACHGSNGLGDGTAGKDLRPSPALLAYMIGRPRSVDEYLLWTISEGGAGFGTAMPAFKDTLTEPQIWQIVVFMRAGFPPVDAGGSN